MNSQPLIQVLAYIHARFEQLYNEGVSVTRSHFFVTVPRGVGHTLPLLVSRLHDSR